MTLEQYIANEFKIVLTAEQLKQIKKLATQPAKVSIEYKHCVDFWLKEFHPNWDFRAMHGNALKQIIIKIKKRLVAFNMQPTQDKVLQTFKYICQNLPEWYKDKDLPIINSKFNEITEQIKKPKTGSKRIDVDNLSRIANERYS